MIKRLSFTLLILFSVSLIPSYAKIYRIGYPGNSVSGVDYAYNNIPAAITAASSGDTIHLYQAYWASSSNTGAINKRLIFIGYGYLLDQNLGLQAISNPPSYCVFSFEPGSEGSVVQGASGNFYFGTSNIAVLRSSGNFNLGYGTYSGTKSGTSNITLIDNFIESSTSYSGVGTLYISNCIFNNSISNFAIHSGVFINNVVYGSPTLGSFIVKNNIFFGGSCPPVNSNVFEYNLFSSQNTCSITGTGNQFNVNMANVFEKWNASAADGKLFTSDLVNQRTDNKLALKTPGLGIGAGRNSDGSVTDLGIFGGEPSNTYKLSGIPPIPAIYKLSASSQTATTNPYTITISIRSNN
jgi:hypothetical protein